VEDLADCPYLDGVIQEALRLHPPVRNTTAASYTEYRVADTFQVPSGCQRETPSEGLTLPNGTYIPGNIIVYMPIYCIQRDARYFSSPLTFLPERWTDEQPDTVIDRRAFMPFVTGVYNCAGQKLAMLELRSVTANLVRCFEIDFAEGEDGAEIEGKTRDCFTTNVGKLDVRLRPRYKA
jgi:cytochrome P450